jgi:hypothetical protein
MEWVLHKVPFEEEGGFQEGKHKFSLLLFFPSLLPSNLYLQCNITECYRGKWYKISKIE